MFLGSGLLLIACLFMIANMLRVMLLTYIQFEPLTVVILMLVGFYIGSRPSGILQKTFCAVQ